MAIKGFGVAVKLTLGGNNQFTHPSTYVFVVVVVVCILTQMNYFNKALSQFSTNIVNPLYYVTFTTFTLIASFILFKGFNTTDPINTISLLCGFLIIFTGVYLLNLSRDDPDGRRLSTHTKFADSAPTDPLAALHTRSSMQARRSSEAHRRSGSNGTFRIGGPAADREHLMQSYDLEAAHAHANGNLYALGDLAEDSDEEADAFGGGDAGAGNKRTSFDHKPPQRTRTVEFDIAPSPRLGKGGR
ncbi:hypothetical protein LTR28_009117 [Elasticomyces elasticus]|nr:hypothetical protein LTR28_009117 [Elasticomyces elasticus]